MKIGILTFFRTPNNAGTFLQAASTLLALKAELPDANIEFIDVSYRGLQTQPFYSEIGRRRLLDVGLAVGAFKKHRSYQKGMASLPRSRHHQIKDRESATDFIQEMQYDAIIVGSDEILRFSPSAFSDGNELPISWLHPRLTARKLMLSSSLGVGTWDSVAEPRKQEIRESLAHFEWLGVRDSMTEEFMQSAGPKAGVELNQVPDPTFSLDLSQYSDTEFPFAGIGRDSDPVIAFRLPPVPGTTRLLDRLRGQSYQLVALSDHFPQATSLASVLPLDNYPTAFKRFSVVVTSSFHELIFSLRNGIPCLGIDFLAHRVDPVSGQSKISDLLQRFGLRDSNYLSADQLEDTDYVLERIEDVKNRFSRDEVADLCHRYSVEYRTAVQKVGRLITNPR